MPELAEYGDVELATGWRGGTSPSRIAGGHTVVVETLVSKQVSANPWMSVREDEVRRPDGSTGIYSVVDCPDIALVIPADGDKLQLVEQYRYPVAGRRWEFPSGTDPRLDADPSTLAARELREETGLVARTMTPLGLLEITPSMLSHRCRVSSPPI